MHNIILWYGNGLKLNPTSQVALREWQGQGERRREI